MNLGLATLASPNSFFSLRSSWIRLHKLSVGMVGEDLSGMSTSLEGPAKGDMV